MKMNLIWKNKIKKNILIKNWQKKLLGLTCQTSKSGQEIGITL